ncbi:ABC transporter permease [Rhizobium sp. VS19-DRK62.2]|uniref:ABC transporter permease n=2 Tax=unclassified Rhizobium TaxID=2613769 RepID=UPI001CC3EB42|nr:MULTISPECIES: ABC transporter permease [unclassified Rhizobium]MBZ5769068.1 ABC transporter permease [Rhizobium sp. VS19-DR129.2]MBZ5776643.1 ABC transporter permease [Rhizobium sp. VS19-DRK62.2]MBZ5787771.1 ABC transporter permease [Rhizobium sp. VS19-DR121]MBZ5805141.1 ABC transporter permease [Rhizobium sp. VS19-DR181]MBZ5820868.1 ABC transporter permease [Rhizobium sp. VS19-DR183]
MMSRLTLAPWTYGFIVALVMWIATTAYAGFGSAEATLTAALTFGAFSVLVGTGQMLVIASGPGNIDLSVPSVLTLAAYVSMTVMKAQDGMILAGLLAAIAVGAVAGMLNFLAITMLRLPPIIATLAWSFVFQSFAFNLGGETTLKPPAMVSAFTQWRVGGIPFMPFAVMLLTVITMLVLSRGIWGRRLLAVGQSEPAARLAGISAGRVRLIAYSLCGVAGGLAGFLLSGFSGGAALNMGDVYLLESIAVVVLGGTSVAGGQANAVGIWGAALFFNLMATMLNTFQMQAGVRFVLSGALIILIVAIAPRPRVA